MDENIWKTLTLRLIDIMRRQNPRMVKDEGDIIWVTINGKHIPIRTKEDVQKISAAAKKPSYKKRKHGKITLGKEEYARVVSEINTHLPKEQRKKKYCSKAVGNYIYYFKNNGFGDYEFFGKKKI